MSVVIFHGTEGYPEENWFPWVKDKLQQQGCEVFVPQFPSPPEVPAKINEWFDVLKKYESRINGDTILIGHSLGGVFALKVLEKLAQPVMASVFVGTPIGVRPILNYERDNSFSAFTFDWEVIKKNAGRATVFHSDDDPYVDLENGKQLAQHLGVDLTFVPGAGHFNAKAGYTEFAALLDKLQPITR